MTGASASLYPGKNPNCPAYLDLKRRVGVAIDRCLKTYLDRYPQKNPGHATQLFVFASYAAIARQDLTSRPYPAVRT